MQRFRHAVFTGTAGAGKTTLILSLLRQNALDWTQESVEEDPPFGRMAAVRVPASALADGLPWRDAVASAVNADLGDRLDHALDPSVFDDEPMPGANWLLLIVSGTS
jgi:predicted ATPase